MKKILKNSIIVAFILVLAISVYTHAYDASKEASSLLDEENIYKENNYYVVEGSNFNNSAIIFYPGAKVEAISYLPLAQKLAEHGFNIYIPKMPFQLAVFNKNAAEKIMNNYPEINNFIMAGHSLGGAMASTYTANNEEKVAGLILLAAYTEKDKYIKNTPVLAINGSNDKIIDMEVFEERKENLPSDTVYITIEGGNHSQFGNYGFQDDDGKASISREKQLEIVEDEIKKFYDDKIK
ncbi:MAG: alpha/beta hydrolase [Bacillota bacterium]